MLRPREKEILDCKQKYILWAALQTSGVHKYLEITRIVVIINNMDMEYPSACLPAEYHLPGQPIRVHHTNPKPK